MSFISNYTFQGENETHFFEGECEVEYKPDGDGGYPLRSTFVFNDVVATNKKTGESEFWDDQVPDDFTNFVKDVAEEKFVIE
jgi:hypothetical protein